MDNSLKSWINEMIEKRKARNKKVLMLSVTSFVLVFTILSAIILPAITMKGEPTCGLEEHVHTDECYERVLVCGKEEYTGEEDNQATEETQTQAETAQETEAELNEESKTAEEAQNDEKAEEDKPEREIHVHTDECYELRLICGKEEHTHTKECYKHEEYKEDLIRVYEDDEIKLQVTLKDNSQVPADAELKVAPITEESNPEKYKELFDRVDKEALNGDQTIRDIRFYDIGFERGGENIEPAHGSVRVALEFAAPIFDAQVVKEADAIKVLHFEDDGDIEEITDVIKNASQGVTAVEFSTDSFSSFSVVLPSTTQTGNFYQRVSRIDSTTADYLVVAAQGNYAFSDNGSSNNYKRALTMTQVRGNPDYFTVTVGGTDATTINDMHWKFGATINGASGSSNLKRRDANRYLDLNSSDLISATDRNHTFQYSSVTGTWTVRYNTYYLQVGESNGNFTRSTGGTFERNMVIYKLVNTTLTIPGNVVYDDGRGNNSSDSGDKPTYPPYIEPSDSQSGNFSDLGKDFAAVSDPSTSKIEDLLDDGRENDGRVLSDKSVVYGKDDYNAFTTYNDGIFSVTMSALAQDYNVPLEEHLVSPIDVSIVLDTSGSMAFTYDGATRAKHAVDALNDTINHIMSLHPANRVGLVLFSGGSADFLPLGRFYVGTAGATINYDPGYTYFTLAGNSANTFVLSTASNLRFADTRGLVPSKTFSNSNPLTMNGWAGTYTQHGIQRGANILLDNTDTKYTDPGTGIEVNRIPVMILITDGEPTHGSSNYADPMNGPHYGSGGYTVSSNSKGILGYSTILTATHFKKEIALHYEEVSKFYSIGLGIMPTGTGKYSGDQSASGDHYKRALLDPTPGRISYLISNPGALNHSTTSLQLYQLINKTFSALSVMVDSTTTATVLGTTNKNFPVPYHDFNTLHYTNEAFFGQYNAGELADILRGVIDRSRTVYNYKFELKEILSVEHLHMVDPIGYGMEIKGPPVLRHNGVNYTHTSSSTVTDPNTGVTTTTYHYNYQTSDPYFNKQYDLNEIGVDFVTAANGTQLVHFHILTNEIPIYHPDSSFSFNFESLPVRLIYQVGLTAQALATAKKGDVFYTNRWGDGDSAMAMLRATDDNPYYDPDNYQESSTNKSSNPTSTAGTSIYSDTDGDIREFYLGNNGKITVTNAPTSTSLTVNKIWRANDGTEITDEDILENLPDITVRLYQSTTAGGGGTLIDTVTFGHADGWTYSWTDLDIEDEDENPYYYSISEDGIDGYYTSYLDNDGILGGDITIENRTGGMILPETGGRGIYNQVWIGLIIILVSTAALGLPMIYKKRRVLFERRRVGPSDG